MKALVGCRGSSGFALRIWRRSVLKEVIDDALEVFTSRYGVIEFRACD